MIFVIDDDEMWGNCVEKILHGYDIARYRDGIAAISAMEKEVPKLVVLDMVLDGPNGLTLLHEMQSYEDLAQVPVIIVSGLDFSGTDFRDYGVVRIFDKGKMKPRELRRCIQETLGQER